MRYTVISLSEHHAITMRDAINRIQAPGRIATAIWGDLGERLRWGGAHKKVGDALITPGNSYGDMSGGFDLAVRDYFGHRVQAAVQARIMRDYRGEIPVGSAFVLPLDHLEDGIKRPAAFDYLVYAPTMRIPKRLNPEGDEVYTSILASLQAIHAYNQFLRSVVQDAEPIEHVWLTTHGIGTGGLSLDKVVRQTVMAIDQCEKRYLQGQLNTVARDQEIHRV